MTREFCVVIGSPIARSLSPAMHLAEFRRRGSEIGYRAVEVTPETLGFEVDRLVREGAVGFSVTMPLKEAAHALVDRLDPSAARCRSVNTIVVGANGELLGADTDGDGALGALVRHGARPSGARCAVFGAGGASRAIVHALAGAGAAEVLIVARDRDKAGAAAVGCAVARAASIEEARGADIVVNATPLGMLGVHPGATPVPASWHRAGSFVLDCVYRPLQTTFLADARAAGATVVDGLWMLVLQAVGQQRWWFDVEADVDVMRAAALAQLDER